jgi:hypothetical protein
MNNLYSEVVINLQYVDDTLLFLDTDVQGAYQLKWLMTCFEHLSGMEINYHKSDMASINLEARETIQFAKIFCCKLRKEDIQPMVDKIINRIPG